MLNLRGDHNPLRSPNEWVFARITGIFSFIREPFLHLSQLPFVFGRITPCIVYQSRRKFLWSFFRGQYFSLFLVQDWVFGLIVCITGQKVIIPRNHKAIFSCQLNAIRETLYRKARRPGHFPFGESVESLENITVSWIVTNDVIKVNDLSWEELL